MTGQAETATRGWRFWAVVQAIIAVLAAANLPTPLYRHDQRLDHLSTATPTVVFAAYVVAVAVTPGVAGQPSDLFGRHAILVPTLGFAVLSAARLAASAELGWLVTGRVASGIASGAVIAAGQAVLADFDQVGDLARASTVASTAVAAGPIVSSLFARYAPYPDHLVCSVLVVVLTAGLIGVAVLPRQPLPAEGVRPWRGASWRGRSRSSGGSARPCASVSARTSPTW